MALKAIQTQLDVALNFDTSGQQQFAFSEYTKCVTMIASQLSGFPAGAIKPATAGKLIRLCRQCLDRLASLSGQEEEERQQQAPSSSVRQPSFSAATLPSNQRSSTMSTARQRFSADPFLQPSTATPTSAASSSTSFANTSTNLSTSRVDADASLEAEFEAFMAEGRLPDPPASLIRPEIGAPAVASSSTAIQPGMLRQYEIYPAPKYAQTAVTTSDYPDIPSSPLLDYRLKTVAWLHTAQQKLRSYKNTGNPQNDLAATRRLQEDLDIMKTRLENVDRDIARLVNITMIQLDPGEVAAQLCLITFPLFLKIEAQELHAAAKGNVMQSLSLITMCLLMRYIRRWVVAECVRSDQINDRVNCIVQFIRLALICLEINHFESATALVLGLRSPALQRLKKTWSQVPRKFVQSLDQMAQLTASTSRFEEMKASLRSKLSSLPVQPYMGMLIDDVVFAYVNYDTGAGMMSEPGQRIIGQVEDLLRRTKSVSYNYKEDLNLQHYLLTRVHYTEDDSFEMSLLREPPTSGEIVTSERSTNSIYDYYLQMYDDQQQQSHAEILPSYEEIDSTSSTLSADFIASSTNREGQNSMQLNMGLMDILQPNTERIVTDEELQLKLSRLLSGNDDTLLNEHANADLSVENDESILSQLPSVPNHTSSGSSSHFAADIMPTPSSELLHHDSDDVDAALNAPSTSKEDDMDDLLDRLAKLHS